MSACTFFGHRNAPEYLKNEIYKMIEFLIKERRVDRFYVGNNGNFDRMVLCLLEGAKGKYPFISYYVVLAYHPVAARYGEERYYKNTIIADRLEGVPKRFAISKRNGWMIEKSDYMISYVTASYGGAYSTTMQVRNNSLLLKLSVYEGLELYQISKSL